MMMRKIMSRCAGLELEQEGGENGVGISRGNGDGEVFH